MVTRLLQTRASAATVLIRIMVGAVFLSEGIQKFLFASELGVGRFARIGIPAPELMAPLVGVVEVFCGVLVIVGLLTRLASLALLINISVALVSTKLPILLGHPFWIFSLRKLERYGFWTAAHESWTDLCMWLGSLFLVILGAGYLSLDAFLAARKSRKPDSAASG